LHQSRNRESSMSNYSTKCKSGIIKNGEKIGGQIEDSSKFQYASKGRSYRKDIRECINEYLKQNGWFINYLIRLLSLINNMNKLSLDVLENIRLLLDKPISPLTQRQIIDLVAKQTVPASQILPLFTSKYRSDLILSLLHKENIPLATINFLLQHLRKDIHKYSQ